MATKKSAKSKGYRRQTTKKPYLSKKEIATLCVILAVLAVAAFFLFRYDDGALKVQDGAVVTEGDNWLIANGSNVRGGVRYYKLGEIGQIDGYSREKGTQASDANLPEYSFTPASQDASDVTVTVTCGHGTAQAMADYARSLLESGGITGIEAVQTAELAGRQARWYSYATGPAGSGGEGEAEAADADAPAEGADADAADTDAPTDGNADTADTDASSEDADADTAAAPANADAPADSEGNRYTRALAGYIDASHECCVIVNVVSRGNTDDDCLPDDVLLEILEEALSAVTLEA